MPNSYLDSNGLKHYTDKLLENIQSNASGVTSFNGRTGAITPQSGDYTAAMVSAVPTSRTVNGKALSSNIILNSVDVASGSGANSIAIGRYAASSAENSIAIGQDASCINSVGISIGRAAKSSGALAIAIGSYPNAVAGIAIGAGANAQNGVAIGGSAITTNSASLAILGKSNGSMAIAIGAQAAANGYGSMAIGGYSNSVANGIAIGQTTNAMNESAIAIGRWANANGKFAIAIGKNAAANTEYSIGLGSNTFALANYSAAIGYFTYVNSEYSTAIGYHAACAVPNSIQLGDGSNLSKLSCKVALSVTSDERDKTDITPIDDGAVEFLNRIKAIRYVFNGRELYIDNDENLSDVDRANKSKYGMCSYDKEAHALGTKKGERVRVGVLAQEVQKALQEVYGDKSYANLVDDNFFDLDPSTIPEGVENKLTMTYENFIPFLIKAVQELDQRVRELESTR